MAIGEAGGAAAGYRLALPVRRVTEESPFAWLAAAWRDMRRAPGVSLAYGAAFAGLGFILTLGLWLVGLFYLILPIAAGFMFFGPLAAVGLYDISRRLERGVPVGFDVPIQAWRANVGRLAVLGLILMLFLLAWIRIATLLFALLFPGSPPSWEGLISSLLFTAEGLPLLLAGTAIGAVLAAIAFSISVVSLPVLLDRDVGTLSAVATSVAAVRANPRVMIGWAALIVLFTAAGLALFFVGLAVTLPLIGYASWHAYRDLVVADSTSQPAAAKPGEPG